MIDPRIALMGQAPQIESPQSAEAGAAQVQNLQNVGQLQQGQIAAQPGQLQAQSLANQQTQQQLDQTKALNAAYAGALTPGANGGAPTLDTDKLTNALALGGHGSAIPGVMKGVLENQTAAADLAKKKTDLATAESDYFGGIGSTVAKAGNDPRLLLTMATHAMAAKAVDPTVAGPLIQQLEASLQTDPSGAQARTMTAELTAHLIASSPAQQKLIAENQTSQSKADVAAIDLDKWKTAKPAQQLAMASQALKNTTNQADYAAVYNQLPAGVVAGFDSPANWTPQSAAKAQAAGLTSEQAQTAANAANTLAATQARDANMAARGNATLGIEAARLALAQKTAAGADDPLAGRSGADIQRLKLIADGQLPPLPARAKNYQADTDALLAIDPTYTESRYLTTKSFKTGGDANNLVILTTALAHLDRALGNSAALGTSPTQALNITPNQHRYSADVDLLTGEIGKLVKAGVVSEGESNRLTGNLKSTFQSNRDAGLDELKDLMAGKVGAIAQKYQAGTGRPIPRAMFDPATQARMAKYGIGAGTDIPASGAPAPAAAAAPAVGTSIHGIPDIGSTFNGGKVLKVTRIQ